MGKRHEAVETALMLTDTIRENLGAPPPYAGHAQDTMMCQRLFDKLRAQAELNKVA